MGGEGLASPRPHSPPPPHTPTPRSGQCNDVEQTAEAIIDASSGPISIIIVGVGGADFSAMEFLDSDDRRLSANGKTAQRDIVQFVPYRKFGGAGVMQGARLAAEVLAELPDQVTGYFSRNGIMPAEVAPMFASLAPAAFAAAAAAGGEGARQQGGAVFAAGGPPMAGPGVGTAGASFRV